MSYDPPTAPIPTGSSPAPKLRKRPGGCLGTGVKILGLLFAGFIVLTVAALAFAPDSAFDTPAETVTVTVPGEDRTVTITPSPEKTTVTVRPSPEKTTVTRTVTASPEPAPTVTRTVTVAPPQEDAEDPAPAREAPAPRQAPPAPRQDPAPPAPAPVAAYANCQAVRDAGAAPIYAGQPGFSSKLDRDGDGVACE